MSVTLSSPPFTRSHLTFCYCGYILMTLKICTMWELWIKFYLGQSEGYAQKTAPQTALRSCSKEAGEHQHVCDFGEEGIHAIKHIFFQRVSTSLTKLCYSWGTVIIMKDFSAFLDMGRNKSWAHKISSWKHLSEDLPCQFSSEHRVPHFCSPPWTPFRGCWRSVAAAAHDLILTEIDGKLQCKVDS